MVRRPRSVPLSRLIGATPTRAAILRRLRWPKFGQFGDQGAQRCFADTGYARQEIGIGLPGRGLTDRAVDVAFEFGEFGLQHRQMPLDRPDHPRLAGHAAAIAFSDDHLDDLAAARHQLTQGLRLGIGNRSRRRLDRLGEMGDSCSIDPVGLGQFAGRAGEIADLARVDDSHRQARCGKRASDDGLIAAGWPR